MDENNEHMPVFLHHAIREGRARGQRSVSTETEMVLHEACGLDSAKLEFPLELGVSCAATMPGIIKSTNAAPAADGRGRRQALPRGARRGTTPHRAPRCRNRTSV
jgi:hypothetical protein